jgi:hypothetical protein
MEDVMKTEITEAEKHMGMIDTIISARSVEDTYQIYSGNDGKGNSASGIIINSELIPGETNRLSLTEHEVDELTGPPDELFKYDEQPSLFGHAGRIDVGDNTGTYGLAYSSKQGKNDTSDSVDITSAGLIASVFAMRDGGINSETDLLNDEQIQELMGDTDTMITNFETRDFSLTDDQIESLLDEFADVYLNNEIDKIVEDGEEPERIEAAFAKAMSISDKGISLDQKTIDRVVNRFRGFWYNAATA